MLHPYSSAAETISPWISIFRKISDRSYVIAAQTILNAYSNELKIADTGSPISPVKIHKTQRLFPCTKSFSELKIPFTKDFRFKLLNCNKKHIQERAPQSINGPPRHPTKQKPIDTPKARRSVTFTTPGSQENSNASTWIEPHIMKADP